MFSLFIYFLQNTLAHGCLNWNVFFRRDEGDDQRIHPSMSRVKAPLDADVDPSFSSLATGHLEASIEPRAYAGDPYVIIHDSSTEIIIVASCEEGGGIRHRRRKRVCVIDSLF